MGSSVAPRTHRLASTTGGSSCALPVEMREAMVAHSRFWAPEEACGLLAGDESGLRMVYCLTNVERSDARFTVAPREQFHAMRHAERNGWEIVGSFHSHPAAPAVPSSVDVAGALDPSWLYVIVSLDSPDTDLRAYRIVDGSVSEVALTDPAGSP